PAQPADEVAGQITPRVVCRLSAAPMLSDALCRISRSAREQLLDRRERQLQLAQHHHKACLVKLPAADGVLQRRERYTPSDAPGRSTHASGGEAEPLAGRDLPPPGAPVSSPRPPTYCSYAKH